MNRANYSRKQLIFAVLITAALTMGGILLSLGLLLGRDGLAVMEGFILFRTLFVEEADTKLLADEALSAMETAAGERWTTYMDAEWFESVRENRSNMSSGIGVMVIRREEGLLVTDVTANGGADRAGIRSGEMLIAVDGYPLSGDQQVENMGKIAGEVGSKITLQILNENEIRTIEVERGNWFDPPVRSYLLEGNVGYVRLLDFHTGAAQAFQTAIEDLMDQGAVALLIDVRQNGGGYLRELEEILDLLLPEGELFRQEAVFGIPLRHRSDAACVALPKAVLLDSGSYSAAELLAAQLRESENALLIGEHTTGKGYFQYPFPLTNGGALNLSIGKYTTGKGVSLARTGVKPDVTVTLTPEELAYFKARWLPPESDPQIQAALAALTEEVSVSLAEGRF